MAAGAQAPCFLNNKSQLPAIRSMFPLKDDIPANRFPVVNISLIAVNILVFIYEIKVGSALDDLIMNHGFVPARFTWQQAENIWDLSRFQPVLSSMFLHAGPFHLISNMWMLWIFGDNIEDCMGHGRYLTFYLLCGVVSVFVQAMAWPDARIPLIGASGAISGVLGAYFLTYPQARVLTLVPIFILFYLIDLPAYFFLGFWFVMQFMQGSAILLAVGGEAEGGVAWWAHIGGFGAGALLIHFFRSRDWRRIASRPPIRLKRIRKDRW